MDFSRRNFSLHSWRQAAICVLAFLLHSGDARAQDLEDAARELGRRIIAQIGPVQRVVLSYENVASLGAREAAGIRQALETELLSHGTRLLKEAGADAERIFTAHITFSENLQGLVWVAELRRGEAGERQVAIVALNRPETSASEPSIPVAAIERKLLWRQGEPILDFALLPAAGERAARMLVLEPSRVRIFAASAEGWTLVETLPIHTARPPARDPRGMIHATERDFRVFMPGLECAGSWPAGAERASFSCGDAASVVPLRATSGWTVDARFVPARNSLVAELRGAAAKFPPFYSLAAVPLRDAGILLVAALDGAVHLFAEDGEALGEISGWGSDIAGIRSECGSGWQVLTTSAGAARDSIRAFEVEDSSPAPVSEAAEFSGAVTALWAREDGRAASAVVRDAQTGIYEAYLLTLACR